MSIETLFTSMQPVEQYLALVESAWGELPTPPERLAAVDVFLLRQIAAMYPVAPNVIDLAAAQTLGASSIAWASHPGVRKVVVPVPEQVHKPRSPEEAWPTWIKSAAEVMPLRASALETVPADALCTQAWSQVEDALHPLAPVVLHVALEDGTFEQHVAQLQHWAKTQPRCVMFVSGLGPLGKGGAVEAVQALVRLQPELNLLALRECSPFFSACRLALVYHQGNSFLVEILERLQKLFQGNFDFLTLAKENIDLRFECQRRSHELPAAPPSKQKLGRRMVRAVAGLYRRVTPEPIRARLQLGNHLRSLSR